MAPEASNNTGDTQTAAPVEEQKVPATPAEGQPPQQQGEATAAAEPVAEATAEPAVEAAVAAETPKVAAETAEGAGDADGAEDVSADDPAVSSPGPGKWYAVHTYSGHENKARLSLLDRIAKSDVKEKFGEVLIPTESVVEMVKGHRRTTTRKFYPGYMFVRMELNELTFHLVKNTPKIAGFLGGTKPVPVKDDEIAGINRQITEGAAKPKPKMTFERGESIRVSDGPFSNFTGVVEEIRPEKQKVRVLVSMCGRATPLELDFSQVEKA